MEDMISRKMAIDALNEQIEQCDKALSSFDITMKDEYAVKVERASLVAYKEQLEALPSAQSTMGQVFDGDTINRQAAIDAVKWGIIYADEINTNTGEVKELCKEGNDALKKAVERIKDLPSAQPEPCEDTISRKKAIEAFENLEWFHQNVDKDMVSGANPEHHQAWYKEQDVYKTLEQLPSVQPEIVRCKDCKHQVKEWRTDKKLKNKGYMVCGCEVVGDACGYWALLGQDDDYCSRAERRTDERNDDKR